MKAKIINSIIPPIFGILTILAILIIAASLYNSQTSLNYLINSDLYFYIFFVPAVAIIAIIIQFALTLPILKRFKNNKKVLGLKLIPFTIIITIIAGLAFGFFTWETPLGITELLYCALTGIIAFAVYWTINLLTVRFFDRLFKSTEMKYAT